MPHIRPRPGPRGADRDRRDRRLIIRPRRARRRDRRVQGVRTDRLRRPGRPRRKRDAAAGRPRAVGPGPLAPAAGSGHPPAVADRTAKGPPGPGRASRRQLPGPDRGEQAQQGGGEGQGPTSPGPVIEYRIDGQADVVRLITSLLDHEKYPAAELAALYARRWETEPVFDEIKTHQRGRPVLRSQTPDGVRRKVYAHLIVHHATRDLLNEAARILQSTAERTSFTRALHVVRRTVISPSGFSPLGPQT
ncbi:transposase [Streptomyces hygroscopicus]|uniref:transposase n=1 Tax=Streptomyces hygroscopicus TaxID=1912 RepID=UPI0036C922A3